jgi:hypothetical protein
LRPVERLVLTSATHGFSFTRRPQFRGAGDPIVPTRLGPAHRQHRSRSASYVAWNTVSVTALLAWTGGGGQDPSCPFFAISRPRPPPATAPAARRRPPPARAGRSRLPVALWGARDHCAGGCRWQARCAAHRPSHHPGPAALIGVADRCARGDDRASIRPNR